MGAEKAIVQRQPIHARIASVNAAEFITVAEYMHWEIEHHLAAETPGKFGCFTESRVAA